MDSIHPVMRDALNGFAPVHSTMTTSISMTFSPGKLWRALDPPVPPLVQLDTAAFQ